MSAKKRYLVIDKTLKIIVLIIIITFLIFIAISPYLEESSQWQGNLTAVRWSSAALGDVNKDGFMDLVLSGCTQIPANSCSGYISKIYINNGSSLVENGTWDANLTAVNRGSLSLGDIDNDGDLDLALVGCDSGGGNSACDSRKAFIYINNGSSFNSNNTWGGNLTGVFHGSLAFGDVNNDGLLDLVVTGSGSIQKIAKVYLNNGSALVENLAFEHDLTAVYMSSISLGDFDNDGDLDLIVSGNDGTAQMTKAYLNNGTSFVENSTWEQNLQAVDDSSFTFGDFDNDGDLDFAMIGHYTGDLTRIYQNNGTTFVLYDYESWAGGGLTGIFDGAISWGDYDNDGYLDLAVTGHESYTRIYKNNATTFTRVETDVLSLYGGSIVWGDLENDTDLELLLSGWHSTQGRQIKIYLNNRSLTVNNSLPSAPSSFQNYTVGSRVFFGWNNGSDTETNNTGLYYNLRIGTSSGGNDILTGVFGGSSNPHAGYFGNMMQRRNVTLPLSRFQANTNYYWSVQTIDPGLAKGAWSTEQMFTTSSDITFPTIVVHEPADGLYTNSSTASFIALAVDNNNITNVTLWANFTGTYALNATNSSAYNNTNYTFTRTLADGHYQWAIRACDALNNCNSSLNRTLNVDTTAPSVSLSTPSNATTWTSSNTVTFTWSTTETNPSNCTLYVSDTSKGTTSTSTLSTSLSNAAYTWYVSCTDLANNQARSTATRALTVSYTAPPDTTTTGGGGGGGGTVTTTKFDADLSKTEEKSITGIKGTTRTFTLDGTTQHKITIIDLTKDQATITIESQPITITLTTGQTKRIDLDKDGTDDITITLNSIISGNAVITIKKLPQPTKPAELPKEEPAKPKILFDIKIKPLQKTYFPGEQLQTEIELTNLGTVGKVDVQLNYILYNEKGEITAQHQDIRAVDTVTSFIQTLQIPENTQPGTYQLNVTAQYQNTTNQYTTQIQIQNKIRYIPSWIQKNYKLIAISSTIGIIAIALTITLFRTLRKREEKDKSDIRKIKSKERFLEKEIKKLKKRNQ